MMPLNGAGDNDQGAGLNAEINVTPFIDVMLVLLIIFMVTAPLMIAGVPLKLPKTSAASLEPPKEPIVVSMNKDGQIYLGEDLVTEETMAGRLKEMEADKPGQTVFVRCDRSLDYGRVMELLGHVGACGVSSLSLISEAQQDGQSHSIEQNSKLGRALP
ncbi:ExbD/TolR family protein [Desulfovibrio inopinatus]|uniref:ExbD/TolR family protein n=1 Tax=Desulfovibrio inopinatus TaxID=102109 RepID=UPI00040C7307|nr:ExbD/TolR family protein [Desulfovibrio inopinatus]